MAGNEGVMILIPDETSNFQPSNSKSWTLDFTSLLFCSCRFIIRVHRDDVTGAGGHSVSKMLGSLYFLEIPY